MHKLSNEVDKAILPKIPICFYGKFYKGTNPICNTLIS